MSTRTPIQVPEDLKNEVESFKDKLHVKTNYEVIQRLIAYYNRNEQQKVEDRKQREQQEEKRKETMVYLGEEIKADFMLQGEMLGLKNEKSIGEFLLAHYHTSSTVGKEMLGLLVSLQQSERGVR